MKKSRLSPRRISDQKLLALHAELHKKYLSLKTSADKSDNANLIGLHAEVLEELRSRKLEHTPSSADENLDEETLHLMKCEHGMYLVEPHASWIAMGKKKAIIKAKNYSSYVGLKVYLCGAKIYGSIILDKPKEIDMFDFKQLQPLHVVSDKERLEWWPKAKKLYYYTFEFTKYKRALDYVRPKGIQTFIRNVKVLKEEVKIEDAINYNVKKPNDEQLRDDWRITCAWYASIKRGKKFKYSEKQVVDLATKITKEIARRGIAEFKPKEMTHYARELFERIQRRVPELPIKKEVTITLKFLGTKGLIEELPAGHKKHSSLLITTGGKKLLIDFGEDWKTSIDRIKPDAILLTHAHPDHISGLEGYGRTIYAPQRTIEPAKKGYPKLFAKSLNLVQIPVLKFFTIKEIPSIKVYGVPCVHSLNAPMTGYVIYLGGYRLGYFPDMLSIPNKKALQKLHLYIGDGSTPKRDLARYDETRKQAYGHMNMQRQLKMCEELEIKNVIFTHFGKWAEQTKEEDFEFNGKFQFAKDGQSFTLNRKLCKEIEKAYVLRAKPAWRIFELEDLDQIKTFADKKKELVIEAKWDGLRIQAEKQTNIKIWSDTPRRIEHRLPHQVKELEAMKQKSFRLDGEAIMLDHEKKEALHRTMVNALVNGKFDPTERAKMCHLIIFDCLESEGVDMRSKPLSERLNKLKEFSDSEHVHFITKYLSRDPSKKALAYIMPRDHKQFASTVKKVMEE